VRLVGFKRKDIFPDVFVTVRQGIQILDEPDLFSLDNGSVFPLVPGIHDGLGRLAVFDVLDYLHKRLFTLADDDVIHKVVSDDHVGDAGHMNPAEDDFWPADKAAGRFGRNAVLFYSER